jgi:A/G-specific adenine glycosylase
LVAEILLQKTRAEQVVSVYEALVSAYPTPSKLAKASVETVSKYLARTGLRGKANRLVVIAEMIETNYGGQVPLNREALLAMPGVGNYTANAVLCIVTGARLPMLDEAAGRVLRRVFGIEVKAPAYSDRSIWELAQRLIPPKKCREFNFALLDLGATVCKANKPRCAQCPLKLVCTKHLVTEGAEVARSLRLKAGRNRLHDPNAVARMVKYGPRYGDNGMGAREIAGQRAGPFPHEVIKARFG